MTFDEAHAKRSTDFVSVSDLAEEIFSPLELNAGDTKVRTCIVVGVEYTVVFLCCLTNLVRLMTPCRLPYLLRLT